MSLEFKRANIFIILLLAFGISVAMRWLDLEFENMPDEAARFTPIFTVMGWGTSAVSVSGTVWPGTAWAEDLNH